MGLLTLDEFKEELRVHLGRRESEDDRLTRCLNLAQTRIARVHRWEELEDTETGTFTITASITDDSLIDTTSFASSIRDIYSIRVTDGVTRAKKLRRITPRKFDEQIPDMEIMLRGLPHLYMSFRKHTVIQVYKSPEEAFDWTFRFSNWPTAFTDATPTAVSDLDEKDDMLINLTTSYIFHSLGKQESADKFWGIYASMLKEATGAELEKPDQIIMPDFEFSDARRNTNVPGYLDPFNISGE